MTRKRLDAKGRELFTISDDVMGAAAAVPRTADDADLARAADHAARDADEDVEP